MRNKSEGEQGNLMGTARRAMQALNVAIRYLLAADCPSTSRAFFPDGAPSLDIGAGVLLRRGFDKNKTFLLYLGPLTDANRMIFFLVL
jgi:hypothetical protein